LSSSILIAIGHFFFYFIKAIIPRHFKVLKNLKQIIRKFENLAENINGVIIVLQEESNTVVAKIHPEQDTTHFLNRKTKKRPNR
jgi:hypothetical protein